MADARLEAFERLLDIMDELREKCPWDRKQTMESLRHLTLEESYELSDAILDGDLEEVKKELGDLMLHLVFYSKIGSEKEAFTITDVLNSISDKLVERHPHIYGDVEVQDEEEVKRNWELIKLKEKGNKKKKVLGGVPKSQPALLKAIRIQDKASGVGFDWDKRKDVFDKVVEEIKELEHEIEVTGNTEKTEEEYGDLLFALINYARFIDVNPETALEKTNKKFIRRFNYVEEQLIAQNKSFEDVSLEDMDALWNEAKKLGL
ncbi:nucleoside triphosphate pyrophosphohydrolase [Sediminitomix flava]|uniref:Nucleoside triphosphate pyrophosphohydrolase n=1 Tax=Sediminitomix flava TaxID=379075 RepID=A0A315ZI03_SEDFL|nr:nucleoside triphosphate pyrophosphohydrolase [Sediminitomix flava]PWJ44448.1 XTP/dITP diphosphohydrolase [Sediminitomix flava]